jgi:phage terminase large subunit-like protein
MMTTGSKEFEARVLEADLRHIGDPITRWCLDCAAISSDPNGNIKPVKPDRGRSKNKIDGVVVACMAVGRARNHISTPKPGIRTF